MHPKIAELCIQNRVNMVTTSYISPAMEALNQRYTRLEILRLISSAYSLRVSHCLHVVVDSAVDAGITILNEIGLDPGIDHLTAMRTIDETLEAGGKITSFKSWCGGLPSPEASRNALVRQQMIPKSADCLESILIRVCLG
jgi:saccharopine dehydrogenase-like NADP-dependent oxidoreductase